MFVNPGSRPSRVRIARHQTGDLWRVLAVNKASSVYIDRSGNLLIGVGSPAVDFEIARSGANATFGSTSYGNTPSFVGRRAEGTSRAPTQAVSGSVLAFFGGRGYEGTTPGFAGTSSAAIQMKAAESFTSTARGTYVTIETTPIGSTTRAERVRFVDDGSVSFKPDGSTEIFKVDASGVYGIVINKQIFTSSGTFTAPAGTKSTSVFKVTVTGAGGGGEGGATGNVTGGGGGAGGTAIKWYTGLAASTGYTVTIGAGGAAGTTGGGNGSNGGNSSFAGPGSTITGNGGTGGGGAGDVVGPPGGTASNGDVNLTGGSGGSGTGGTGNWKAGGFGGGTPFGAGGSGGAASTIAAAGGAGAAYGTGGGGGNATDTNQAAGGAGAGGVVIVEWIL